MDDFQKILEQVQSSSVGPTTPAERQGSGNAANPVVDALAERLLKQGQGISTSASSQIQSTIGDAMNDVRRAGNATSQRLQSERQREVGFAADRAQSRFTGALEGRTGYATQVAALRELTETTEKSIRDLDQRYQEAIMSNDAQTASSLADLRLQKLEFVQEQEQQFYTNLFSLAGVMEQQASRESQEMMQTERLSQQQRLQREKYGFDFAMVEREVAQEERQQMLSLAAEYGVQVDENDTLEGMIDKVSPYVDEERRMQLQKVKSEIQNNRARTSEILNGDNESSGAFDEFTTNALATAYMQGKSGFLANVINTPEQSAQVANRVSEMETEKQNTLEQLAKESNSPEEFRQNVLSSDKPYSVTAQEVESFVNRYTPEWRERRKDSGGGMGFDIDMDTARKVGGAALDVLSSPNPMTYSVSAGSSLLQDIPYSKVIEEGAGESLSQTLRALVE